MLSSFRRVPPLLFSQNPFVLKTKPFLRPSFHRSFSWSRWIAVAENQNKKEKEEATIEKVVSTDPPEQPSALVLTRLIESQHPSIATPPSSTPPSSTPPSSTAFIVIGTALTGIGTIIAAIALWYTKIQADQAKIQADQAYELSYAANLNRAIDKIVNGVWSQPTHVKYVSRPELEASLREFMDQRELCYHAFIFGSRGAGKSTLLRHMLKDEKGVLFVNVYGGRTILEPLCEALGMSNPANFDRNQLLKEAFEEAHKRLGKLPVVIVAVHAHTEVTRDLLDVQKILTRDIGHAIVINDCSSFSIAEKALTDPTITYQFIPEMTLEEGRMLAKQNGLIPILEENGISFEEYFSNVGANAGSLLHLSSKRLISNMRVDLNAFNRNAEKAWQTNPSLCEKIILSEYGEPVNADIVGLPSSLVLEVKNQGYVLRRGDWMALKRKKPLENAPRK